MNHVELGERLETKRSEYGRKWESYPTKTMADGQKVKDIPANELEGLRALMDDINDLSVKHDAALLAAETAGAIKDLATKSSIPANRISSPVGTKGVAECVLDSMQWKGRVGGNFGDIELSDKALDFLETKATMTTSAGFAPHAFRDGTVVPAIYRPPQLIDHLRLELTDQNSIKFMKQSTRTNTAAGKAEGSAFDEATIVFTESTVDIRKIGVFLPVTEEQLDDELGVKAIIENDLSMMVRQVLDEQVTVGDGTGQNIKGLFNATNAQVQARGTDEEFDQIMKAMTLVRTNGRAVPNLVVLPTGNYQRLALTKTADGIYVFGHPSETPLSRVWGVPIVQSEALAAGTGLVFDSGFARIKLRKDLTVASSDSHGDYFKSNMVAFRAHVRAGLQILRDESICKLTGLRS